MVLHSNAVPQNCPARIRTSRIDRDNADLLLLFAIVFGKLIHQRTLARSRSARKTDNARLASVWEESLEQFRPTRSAVFHRGDGPRQRQRLAGTKT